MLVLRSLSITLVAAAALNANTVFFDGTFSTGWSDTTVTNQNMTSQTYTTSNPATGGNGTFYREESHTMTRNVSSLFAAGRWLSLNTNALYDPSSQGAINSLDYSFDLRVITHPGGAGVGYALGLTQNGNTYISACCDAANSTTWTTSSHTGLLATNFSQVLDSGPYPHLDTLSHPDFSSAGTAIQFGYIVLNSFNGSATLSGSSGIDNWSVELHTDTPEPSTLFSLAMGLTLVCIARRRRGIEAQREITSSSDLA
jgi:hypothetical protein